MNDLKSPKKGRCVFIQ